MSQSTPLRLDVVDHELLEGVYAIGPKVTPVIVAPVSRLRSPIMEHRPVEPLPPDDDRPAVLLPPLRAFVGPTRFALLVAAPVFLVTGLQFAVLAGVAATVFREFDRRVGRATFSFGDGFLPYRAEAGWPRGVQEEDDVRWNWSPIRDSHGTHS